MAKALTELTDAELELASDRAWRKYYEYVKETDRRFMIARYGSAVLLC
jgi:hypothetical protein